MPNKAVEFRATSLSREQISPKVRYENLGSG